MLSLIWRRNWALRLSIVLNVCVLLYVCAHFGAVSGPWIEDANWGGSPTSELVYGTAPRPNATVAAALVADSSGKMLEIQRPNETKTLAATANEISSPDKLTPSNNQTVRLAIVPMERANFSNPFVVL